MSIKIVSRSIQDAECDHVVELAMWGIARKMIAMEVYGTTKDGEPSERSLMRVHHILRAFEIGVTDYRMGRNKNGKTMLTAIRRETDIVDAIRVASKEVLAQFRKTG